MVDLRAQTDGAGPGAPFALVATIPKRNVSAPDRPKVNHWFESPNGGFVSLRRTAEFTLGVANERAGGGAPPDRRSISFPKRKLSRRLAAKKKQYKIAGAQWRDRTADIGLN